jgi:[ribosomal protein S18]-alanine N-acetyltransferase
MMSIAGLHIREAGQQDLVAVLTLERNSAEAPHWNERDYSAIISIDKESDTRLSRCLLIADWAGRVVGFAVGKIVGSGPGTSAELESVVVEAAARRLGVGRALCRAVAASCRQRGAESLELEVRVSSQGAIALYTGLGFVVTGRRRAYYQEPVEDAVLMRLELEKAD